MRRRRASRLSPTTKIRLNEELVAEKDKVELQKKVDRHAATIASIQSEIVNLKSERGFYKNKLGTYKDRVTKFDEIACLKSKADTAIDKVRTQNEMR